MYMAYFEPCMHRAVNTSPLRFDIMKFCCNLLYAQYLMLCGFSCFELFKFSNSALCFSNVGVSAHCMLSATLFTCISHSAEVAKTQHHNYLYRIQPKLQKRNIKNFANYAINIVGW